VSLPTDVSRAGKAILNLALAEEPVSRATLTKELGAAAGPAIDALRQLGLIEEESAGQIRATRAAQVADAWVL
jgi:hypothetical protein